jgi:t-SNARE complex subunit (syntaxin)
MAYQMMQDLAILVHAQGEQIGLISENISKAQNYIQKAEKNMVSAKKHHQASRKVI